MSKYEKMDIELSKEDYDLLMEDGADIQKEVDKYISVKLAQVRKRKTSKV